MFGGVTGLLLFLAAWPTMGDFFAPGQNFAAFREPSGKPMQARQLQLTSAETALAQDATDGSPLVGSLSELDCGDDACRLDRYRLRNPLAVDEGPPHLFTSEVRTSADDDAAGSSSSRAPLPGDDRANSAFSIQR